jgi:arsenate reductase
MRAQVIIYHNPRCSKSRQTLELLRTKGYEPVVVDYLDDPPSAPRVQELIRMLGIAPYDLVRRTEAPYQALGLTRSASAEEVAGAIAAHPILLERPVVVCGARAAIGRPPENVLAILPR